MENKKLTVEITKQRQSAYEAGRLYAITGDEKYAHYSYFQSKGSTKAWEAGNKQGKIESADLQRLTDKFYFTGARKFGILVCNTCKQMYSVDEHHVCTVRSPFH